MNVYISQRYRQSLQPYVEPELLEGIYSLAEPIKLLRSEAAVIPKKQSDRKTLLILLLTGLCLFGSAYHQKTDLQEQPPSLHTKNVTIK